MLLRSRLTKRGIALSAGAFNLALFHATGSASVPPTLVSSTIQSASQIAAGTLLSSPVAVLTEGVLHSMYVAKIKLIAAMVLSIGILGAGTGWILQSAGSGTVASAEDAPVKGTEKKTSPKPQPKENDPAKQPIAEAREREAVLWTAEAIYREAKLEDERLKTQQLLKRASQPTRRKEPIPFSLL